jgi:4-amino-4-deoxy-L-arabinose transferase-like glycosyltransferase
LYIYLVAVVLGVYYGIGRLAGVFQTTADLFRPPYQFDGFIPFPKEFLLARLVTVILALATIWIIYKISRRWLGQTAALIAAALLSFSIFHVTSSHFIATDAPVGLFIVLCLFFCLRLAETGQTSDYVWAGVMAGLAVGTKYSAFVLVVPAALAHLLAWQRGHTRLVKPVLVAMGAAALLAFL